MFLLSVCLCICRRVQAALVCFHVLALVLCDKTVLEERPGFQSYPSPTMTDYNSTSAQLQQKNKEVDGDDSGGGGDKIFRLLK